MNDLQTPFGSGEEPEAGVSAVPCCTACMKAGKGRFRKETTTSMQTYCSEICFNSDPMFSSLKTHCDWCKKERQPVIRVILQEENVEQMPIQFCSEHCLGRYKMDLFCTETKEYLALYELQKKEGFVLSESKKIIATPHLWLKPSHEPLQSLRAPGTDAIAAIRNRSLMNFSNAATASELQEEKASNDPTKEQFQEPFSSSDEETEGAPSPPERYHLKPMTKSSDSNSPTSKTPSRDPPSYFSSILRPPSSSSDALTLPNLSQFPQAPFTPHDYLAFMSAMQERYLQAQPDNSESSQNLMPYMNPIFIPVPMPLPIPLPIPDSVVKKAREAAGLDIPRTDFIAEATTTTSTKATSKHSGVNTSEKRLNSHSPRKSSKVSQTSVDKLVDKLMTSNNSPNALNPFADAPNHPSLFGSIPLPARNAPGEESYQTEAMDLSISNTHAQRSSRGSGEHNTSFKTSDDHDDTVMHSKSSPTSEQDLLVLPPPLDRSYESRRSRLFDSCLGKHRVVRSHRHSTNILKRNRSENQAFKRQHNV